MWKEGKKLISQNKRCSGSLDIEGGRWSVTRCRTEKVVWSPRGSGLDMFVIYSAEVEVVGGRLCPSLEGEC